jgi:hypothetical protein
MDCGLSSCRVAIGILYMKIRPVIVKHRYTNSHSFHNLLNELLNRIYYCAYLYGYPFIYYFVNIYFVLLYFYSILLYKLTVIDLLISPKRLFPRK